jgi:hypothetical protein
MRFVVEILIFNFDFSLIFLELTLLLGFFLIFIVGMKFIHVKQK